MKYMGSKRTMLQQGLSDIVRASLSESAIFADLFTGSGAIAWHVSANFPVRVIASDLQMFAVTLAAAVIERSGPSDAESLWSVWSEDAQRRFRETTFSEVATEFQALDWTIDTVADVSRARQMCAHNITLPVVRSYGGYYFSPLQALTIDTLRQSLPTNEPDRSIALASLIQASAECAASPGHTAQPFKPTITASRYLIEHWNRNVLERTRIALEKIASKHAILKGSAFVAEAQTAIEKLGPGDVAFIDPPYSSVQYSRFYHVLETIAQGDCSGVTGEGRYPPISERPQSSYSLKTKSYDALNQLLQALAEQGAKGILTFPLNEASNGLSGSLVDEMASCSFVVERTVMNGRFSTLGGNSSNRGARVPAYELVLLLTPKRNWSFSVT